MPYVLRVLRVDLSFVCCTTGAGYLENCFASVVVVVIFRDRTFNQLVKKKEKKKQNKKGLGGRMELSGESRRVHAVLRRLM